ncbi:MAG TPA: glycosyltransferase family 2 protein, partial [Burkholderiaceae bacterium]|nr:glycosyltransferase family 2 protein [Burkholderiaceae bacterium]
NRGPLLIERSLQSCLAQTYKNIEVVIVGDHCTDDTAALVTAVKDPRVRFVNREERGQYPEDKMLRWMVAGSIPMNDALRLARGSFVTHLDDDDEHAPDRIERLVAFAKNTRADFIWHPFDVEHADGSWTRNEAASFGYGRVTTSSVFYHRVWKEIEWDPQCFLLKEPGDWNRFRKIRWLGARVARYPVSMLKHYRERSQFGR